MPKKGYVSLTVEKKYEKKVKMFYRRLRLDEENKNLKKVEASLK